MISTIISFSFFFFIGWRIADYEHIHIRIFVYNDDYAVIQYKQWWHLIWQDHLKTEKRYNATYLEHAIAISKELENRGAVFTSIERRGEAE